MLHFCNKSYDIQQGDYKERRVRGTLNAQAYFPWVDENRSRMMCYKVIDPTVALDNGIEAYCYYIREYLEVEVTDEKYQEYLLSLRIYVPSESLSELPLKEIKHRLSDVTFKRIKKKRRSIQFDVKKGEQHLRAILDYRELEQLITLQKYEVKKMDKQLYYRIMVPASLLSVCLFLFLIFLFDQSSVFGHVWRDGTLLLSSS